MRNSIIQVVLASLLVCSGAVYGADLSEYEKTCLDLGFKKRTPAYGECVLELDKRSTNQQKQAERARIEQQRQTEERQRQAQEQQERQAAQQRQQQEQEKAAQLAARGDGTPEHETCQKYGFVAGTAPYAECRQRIDTTKRETEQKDAAEKRRYDEKLAADKREEERQKARFLMGLGAGLLAPPPPPNRSTVNCTSFSHGGRVNTTCD